MKGGYVMRALYERIKEARTELHLSQDYVAKFLGVNRTAIVEIESGKRKVSADELGRFSELFQIPADELLNGRNTEMPVQMFARRFGALDEVDQQEILNLIEFKRMMKERM
jgi:transcriptional regulator with XRE-family HTH domain